MTSDVIETFIKQMRVSLVMKGKELSVEMRGCYGQK